MRTRRSLALSLILIVSLPALAHRARPLSDLRFEDTRAANAAQIASDGKDFLVLSTGGTTSHERVFAQKISATGATTGPDAYVGSGTAAGVIWTGMHYLAAWQNSEGAFVAAISPEGTPLTTPTQPLLAGPGPISGPAFLLSSGNTVMLVGFRNGNMIAQPLTTNGAPLSAPVTTPLPESILASAASACAGRFAVLVVGWHGTYLTILRPDGTALTDSPRLLDGPYAAIGGSYQAFGGVLANDGNHFLAVLETGVFNGDKELKTIVLGPDGEIVHARRTIETRPSSYTAFNPRTLAWRGSEYVLGMQYRDEPSATAQTFQPVLVRIAADGQRIGDNTTPLPEEPRKLTGSLGWNGSTLLFTWNDSNYPNSRVAYAKINSASLMAGDERPTGRTLDMQSALTIAAGSGGESLAAWYEREDDGATIRVSRVDRDGNYLDGEGVVLETMTIPGTSIAIDGNGPEWLVVWRNASQARARALPRHDLAGGPPAFAIGDASQVAVRWNGSRYVVVRSHVGLYADVVTPHGIESSKTLAERIETFDPSVGSNWIDFDSPALASIDGATLLIFAEEHGACGLFPGCGSVHLVKGMRLDAEGAALDATPFTIANAAWDHVSVAQGDSGVLVSWAGGGVFGAYLPAASPQTAGTPFLIHAGGRNPEVAFDDSGFVAAWESLDAQSIVTARVEAGGTVHDRTTLRRDDGETDRAPRLSASTTTPAMLAFITEHPAYDVVPRGALLRFDEIVSSETAPAAPVIECASRISADRLSVQWHPMHDAFGISIELGLGDGSFRAIGVAAGNAGSATVPLAGLEGTAVRLRSWNTDGLSAPSAIAASLPPPAATLRHSIDACAGAPVTITATLKGAPPFTVRWSDGFVQTGLTSNTASRVVTFDHDTTLSIVSVSDASCSANDTREDIRVAISRPPSITQQTHGVHVARGATATLTIESPSSDLHFAWFEGNPGDTTHAVGGDAASFTTPALQRTTRYWARVSTRCGAVDSDAIVVTVNGRQRRMRH